jgi:putative transposase
MGVKYTVPGILLGADFDEQVSYAALRKAESVGRPVGSAQWLEDMETQTGKRLAPRRPGRPKQEVYG